MLIAMFSKRCIVLRRRDRRPRVSGPPGAHIPLGWTRQSHEATQGSLYRCGHLEFTNIRGDNAHAAIATFATKSASIQELTTSMKFQATKRPGFLLDIDSMLFVLSTKEK
jgi:hypothetical protein